MDYKIIYYDHKNYKIFKNNIKIIDSDSNKNIETYINNIIIKHIEIPIKFKNFDFFIKKNQLFLICIFERFTDEYLFIYFEIKNNNIIKYKTEVYRDFESYKIDKYTSLDINYL